jgi:hypothetical protein
MPARFEDDVLFHTGPCLLVFECRQAAEADERIFRALNRAAAAALVALAEHTIADLVQVEE